MQAILSRRSRAVRYIMSPPLCRLRRYVAVVSMTRPCALILTTASPEKRSRFLVGALVGLQTGNLSSFEARRAQRHLEAFTGTRYCLLNTAKIHTNTIHCSCSFHIELLKKTELQDSTICHSGINQT
ncbi:hypothetical protein CONLIGDRAFT_351592 [Coniochaeta ligniaria NRRL 30616]|uniref:Uncharacterized protein n=1 Tax=Coniochaeta ligniaria NRRL 30616 TaxID=1408157 RepID=A0A1J7J9G0_9PEZI|nr:hypothetical protein CONLIGDRAFT_351592 [Coniochaeta ligniaria NRRL 30616]